MTASRLSIRISHFQRSTLGQFTPPLMRIVLPPESRRVLGFQDYIHSNQGTVNKEGSKDKQFAELDRITLSEGDKFKLDSAKLNVA